MVGRLLLGLQLGGRWTGKGWQRPLQHAGAIPGRDLQAQVLHEPGHDLIYIAVDAQVSVAVVLGGLKVDDDQLAPSALGGKGQVTTGPDLQGCTQRDGQVRVPGTRRWVELSTSARVSAAFVLQPSRLKPWEAKLP